MTITETKRAIRLIIVDDDPIIRGMLRTLADRAGASVLAEAENGQTGIEEAERHQPELVLMDVSMPVMGGIAAVRYLHEHAPAMRIILVSQYNQKVYAEEALKLGARGYILKSAVATELAAAIEKVMDGGTFVSARVSA